jgi:hypothetical protein
MTYKKRVQKLKNEEKRKLINHTRGCRVNLPAAMLRFLNLKAHDTVSFRLNKRCNCITLKKYERV